MADPAYRRSRFAEPTSYTAGTSVFAYDESPAPWAQAAEAYDLSTRFEGNREALSDAVTDARWILDLEADWDAEGAAGYREETLTRAAELLRQIADCCWDFSGSPSPIPAINPADDGSIDLSWRTEVRLLINVPQSPADPATFAALGADLELYGSVTSKSLATIVDLLRNGS